MWRLRAAGGGLYLLSGVSRSRRVAAQGSLSPHPDYGHTASVGTATMSHSRLVLDVRHMWGCPPPSCPQLPPRHSGCVVVMSHKELRVNSITAVQADECRKQGPAERGDTKKEQRERKQQQTRVPVHQCEGQLCEGQQGFPQAESPQAKETEGEGAGGAAGTGPSVSLPSVAITSAWSEAGWVGVGEGELAQRGYHACTKWDNVCGGETLLPVHWLLSANVAASPAGQADWRAGWLSVRHRGGGASCGCPRQCSTPIPVPPTPITPAGSLT